MILTPTKITKLVLFGRPLSLCHLNWIIRIPLFKKNLMLSGSIIKNIFRRQKLTFFAFQEIMYYQISDQNDIFNR